jgi:hypothetical protein
MHCLVSDEGRIETHAVSPRTGWMPDASLFVRNLQERKAGSDDLSL